MDKTNKSQQTLSSTGLSTSQPQNQIEISHVSGWNVKDFLYISLSKKYVILYILCSFVLFTIIFVLVFKLIYPKFGYKNNTLKEIQPTSIQNRILNQPTTSTAINSGFNFILPPGALDKKYIFEIWPDTGSYRSSLPEDYEEIDSRKFILSDKTPFQFSKPYQIIYKYDKIKSIDKIFNEIAIFVHPTDLNDTSLTRLETKINKEKETLEAEYNKTASYLIAAKYPPRCTSDNVFEISIDSEIEGLCDLYALINNDFGYSLKYSKDYKEGGYGGADPTGISFNYNKISNGVFNIAIDVGSSNLVLEELYKAEKSFELAPTWKVIDKSQSIESKSVVDLNGLKLLKVITTSGENTNTWYFLKERSLFVFFVTSTPTLKYDSNKFDFEKKAFEIIKTYKTLTKQEMENIRSKYIQTF